MTPRRGFRAARGLAVPFEDAHAEPRENACLAQNEFFRALDVDLHQVGLRQVTIEQAGQRCRFPSAAVFSREFGAIALEERVELLLS